MAMATPIHLPSGRDVWALVRAQHGVIARSQLLALGMKDEAIARYLGWGLRTVRRRVARLMEEHGVDTRFQLGAAVTAAGKVGPQRRPTARPAARSR